MKRRQFLSLVAAAPVAAIAPAPVATIATAGIAVAKETEPQIVWDIRPPPSPFLPSNFSAVLEGRMKALHKEMELDALHTLTRRN